MLLRVALATEDIQRVAIAMVALWVTVSMMMMILVAMVVTATKIM